MPLAFYFRRFWLLAHIGVMVSLLFGTVHPVQPGVATRGTSGRGSIGSRFDLWSDAGATHHDEPDTTIGERRIGVRCEGASVDAGLERGSAPRPQVSALPPSYLLQSTVGDRAGAPLVRRDVLAQSCSLSPAFGRAPPRA